MERDELHFGEWENEGRRHPRTDFLKRGYLGKKLFIKADSLRKYKGQDPSLFRGLWREVREESTFYGGYVRTQKDVKREGFNFYRENVSGADFDFVRFDELEKILVLLEA